MLNTESWWEIGSGTNGGVEDVDDYGYKVIIVLVPHVQQRYI